jgi:hypothetical protein
VYAPSYKSRGSACIAWSMAVVSSVLNGFFFVHSLNSGGHGLRRSSSGALQLTPVHFAESLLESNLALEIVFLVASY